MDSASSRGIRNVEVQPAPRTNTCTVSNGFDVLAVFAEGIGACCMLTSVGPDIVILMMNILFQESVGTIKVLTVLYIYRGYPAQPIGARHFLRKRHPGS